MTRPNPISPFVAKLVSIAVPKERRQEVLTDMANGYRSRVSRLGVHAANRFVYREVVSLFLWRLRWWKSAHATRETADVTGTKTRALGRDVLQDLRYGARALLRQPGFAATAVAVLGLGIGAPATVFTLVNQIFFERPAHIVEPERIVKLSRSWAPGEGGGALQNADYIYYRDNATTLEGLAAYGESRMVAYTLAGNTHDQLRVLFVSDNFFDLLGVTPVLGRTFLPEENRTPGTDPVAVLAHDFWRRALGGDSAVVGSTLTIGGSPYTVVGIAPDGFGSVSPIGDAPDVWAPIAMYGALTRARSTDWWERHPNMRSRWLQALGRLAPGVTFEAARANLVALGESLEFEGKSDDEGAFVQRQFLYSPRLEASLSNLSRMLLAVVAFVLTIAAANVAVLLLTRASARGREMEIRIALGAGRGRLTRQVLVETLLLGVFGGLLGIGLAFLLSDVAASFLPVRFVAEFRPDVTVMVSAFGLSIVTAIIMSLVPAYQAGRGRLSGAPHGVTASSPRSVLRGVLVVGQVSLSLVLVAGALLFGRSFWTARTQELGFDTEDRLVVEVGLSDLDFEEGGARLFLRQALERVRAIPGVRGAAVTRMIPFQGDWTSEFDAPAGAQANFEGDQIRTGMNAVSSDYFEVAGIPIVRGRPLGAEDVDGAATGVVVNEALAEAIWPQQDPLGRTLPYTDDLVYMVVGVARTATYYELGEQPTPQTYLSAERFPPRSVHFLIHTAGPATAMAPVVQASLREIEPRLVFRWVTTMAAVFEEEIGRYEVSAVLVTVFGGIALLLATVGLYGTVSFLVACQTRDIGVRMALGADRRRVAGQVMRFGLRLVLTGVAIGLVGTVALRRFTESMLYGIAPDDPLPLLGACAVLLMVAAVATLAPARNATRVDPMVAMREE